jgi:response regulator of citrate/malate metabolism
LNPDSTDHQHQADRPPTPEGQWPVTSRLVAEALQHTEEPLTAAGVADRLGIARATARSYLAARVDNWWRSSVVSDGRSRRPRHPDPALRQHRPS